MQFVQCVMSRGRDERLGRDLPRCRPPPALFSLACALPRLASPLRYSNPPPEIIIPSLADLPNAIPAGMSVFVPRPGAAADDETDGVVLLDYLGIDGRALMIVLDGKSFREIARVTVPHRHCMSLHNSWMWD